MDPQVYIDRIKNQCKTDIEHEIAASDKNINKIAAKAQSKILGFEVNEFGDITSISTDFIDDLIKDSEHEIELLKKKIQKSAKNKIKNITTLALPDLASYAFRRKIDQIMEEERNKHLPMIRKIIQAEVHKEIVEPWQLIAKMRNIDL